MRRFNCFLVFLCVFASLAFGEKPFGGSDGPTPFMQVPAPRKFPLKLLEPITSYSFLERTEKILYVSSQKRLKLFHLDSGKETLLGEYHQKLFPQLDSAEKHVLSEDFRILKELNTQSPGKEFLLPPTSHFYFWHDNQAFLQRRLEQIKPGTWALTYLVVNPKKNAVYHRTCEFSLDRSVQELKVAQGHRYPEVLLYSEEALPSEKQLALYFIELKNEQSGKCQVSANKSGEEAIQGKISSISWISGEKEVAIITEGEQKNLFFGSVEDLRPAALPQGYSYIPNPQNGIVVNINRHKGLSVYSLQSGRFFNLDIPVDRGFFEGNQIWIDSGGEKLFLSTRDHRDKFGGRTLFSLSLKGLK